MGPLRVRPTPFTVADAPFAPALVQCAHVLCSGGVVSTPITSGEPMVETAPAVFTGRLRMRPRWSAKYRSSRPDGLRPASSGAPDGAVPGGVSPTGPCQWGLSAVTHMTWTTPLRSTNATSTCSEDWANAAIGAADGAAPGAVSPTGPCQPGVA